MWLIGLVGDRGRVRVMVYGHANESDIDETVEAVGHYIDMGYKAVRAQTGVPGIKDAYGVGRGKLYYEPADAALPSLTGWDTRKALRSEEHTSELQSLMRISYAVFCVKKKKVKHSSRTINIRTNKTIQK